MKRKQLTEQRKALSCLERVERRSWAGCGGEPEKLTSKPEKTQRFRDGSGALDGLWYKREGVPSTPAAAAAPSESIEGMGREI